LKILYLLNAYKDDGPGLLINRIAAHLASHEDARVYCAALSRDGVLRESFINKGIPTYFIGMKGFWDYPKYLALKKLLRHEPFDVLHTNLVRADIVGRLAAKEASIPVVVSTEHGTHAWAHWGKAVRALVKKCYIRTSHHAKAIIAVSDYVKSCLLAEGLPEQKVVRIHNGVDTNVYFPMTRYEKENYRKYICDMPVTNMIGFVGNLIEMKGIQYFINALPKVFNHFPELLAIIVGEGTLRKKMEAEVEKLGLHKRVKFLGHVTDVTSRLIASLDILVQPSLTESFGLTAAEALSCEVPVVAANSGGLPEIVEDGVCGYIVPPRDSDALSDKICHLLDNPEKRKAFGTAGRQRVLSKFNIANTAEQYLALYQNLLTSK